MTGQGIGHESRAMHEDTRFACRDTQGDIGGGQDRVDGFVVAVALTHYVFEHFLKATFEYQTRIELHGKKLKNDAAIVGVQLGF